MGQSNFIAASIAVAFLVYITAKGSLPKYLSLLTGASGFGNDTASAGNKTPEKVDSVDALGNPLEGVEETTGENSGDGVGKGGSADIGGSKSGDGKTSTGSSTGAKGAFDMFGDIIHGVIGGDASAAHDGVKGAIGGMIGDAIGGPFGAAIGGAIGSAFGGSSGDKK